MTFSDFYQLYPRHVGRAAAEKAWSKLNPDAALQERIQAALEWQRPMMLKNKPEYIPHPSTWLNQQRWEDEEPKRKAPEVQGTRPAIAVPDHCKGCGKSGIPLRRFSRTWNYYCAECQLARETEADTFRVEGTPEQDTRTGV